MMNYRTPKQIAIGSSALLAGLALSIVPGSALAGSTTKIASQDATKVTEIINRGNAEIGRRLTTLNTLTGKVNNASKLTADDKASLNSVISNEISGLNSLKTKLDADTDITSARTDGQAIFTDYRVYALIVPQINLLKTADDQQVAEGHLTDFAGKVQTKLDAAKAAGKNTTALQTQLNDLTSKVTAAQAISSSIETKVAGLQPSDYNSDHTILSGDRDQLKTAQTDIKTALADGKVIVSGLAKL